MSLWCCDGLFCLSCFRTMFCFLTIYRLVPGCAEVEIMRTIKKTTLIIIGLCFLHLSIQAKADICDDAWASNPNLRTCTLNVQPIRHIPPTDGMRPFPTCELNVTCVSGGTHPEDPNSFHTREINNTKSGVFQVYQPNVNRLANCNGNLTFPPC